VISATVRRRSEAMNSARLSASARSLVGGSLLALAVVRPAAAYIGPGAGLTAIGTMFAVVVVAFLAVVGVAWYPVMRLLRRRRTTRSAADRDAGVRSAAKR
jgi:hypothetical protein